MSRIQDERLAGTLAVLLAVAGLAVANSGLGEGDNGGLGPFLAGVAIVVLLAALIFGRVLPNAADRRGPAIWLAVLSIPSGVVFWIGAPVVLGIGAMVAGTRAGGAVGIAAAVVGGVMAAAGLAACVLG